MFLLTAKLAISRSLISDRNLLSTIGVVSAKAGAGGCGRKSHMPEIYGGDGGEGGGFGAEAGVAQMHGDEAF